MTADIAATVKTGHADEGTGVNRKRIVAYVPVSHPERF
jgi:hypothetical protein